MQVKFRWDNGKEEMMPANHANILTLARKGAVVVKNKGGRPSNKSKMLVAENPEAATKAPLKKQTYQTKRIVAEGTA